MDDLSHYDLFTVFTAHEAACLAAGLDPRSGNGDARSATIEYAMENSLNWVVGNALWALTHDLPEGALPDWALLPTEFEQALEMPRPIFANDGEGIAWLNRLRQKRKSSEKGLMFRREELHRWFKLKGVGYAPRYEFVKNSAAVMSEVDQAGPIAQRERTTYLNTIAALLEMLRTPRDGRITQEDVIVELIENYSEKQGIAKSTLERTFAQANRCLRGDQP